MVYGYVGADTVLGYCGCAQRSYGIVVIIYNKYGISSVIYCTIP